MLKYLHNIIFCYNFAVSLDDRGQLTIYQLIQLNDMTTNLTITQLIENPSLWNYFFRKQSQVELVNLIESSADKLGLLNALDDYSSDIDLDEIEEMFYELDKKELINEMDLSAYFDDDEEEEEDEEDF